MAAAVSRPHESTIGLVGVAQSRAYAVYIIHPPILVGMSLLLHGWTATALAKFAVNGALTCIACWFVADPLVRLPGVRRVV